MVRRPLCGAGLRHGQLVAGPADFNGDGVTDERIPPIWEYGTAHWYRPFDDLTTDVAKVLRFVAVDELIGSSPIYDPVISEPLLADHLEVDLNLFAGRPGRDPAASIRTADLLATLGRLDPVGRSVSMPRGSG